MREPGPRAGGLTGLAAAVCRKAVLAAVEPALLVLAFWRAVAADTWPDAA